MNKRFWLLWTLLVGWGVFAGCQPASVAEDAAPPKAVAPAEPGVPSKAQPKLRTIRLFVGAEELITEIAATQIEQQTGMMFRESMEENEAMIFVNPAPRRAGFWMKNTPLPLSLAYIDSTGKILEIHDLEPFNEQTVWSSTATVRFILEVKQGWFERHNIKPGAIVASERGPLVQTFFQN